jgi:hypothetical protein
MSIINRITERISRMSVKQLAVAGVFTLALAGSIGLGLATRQSLSAATIRDNDVVNSIDGCTNNGGIGAADARELIADIRDSNAHNCQGGGHTDLATIYADPVSGSLTADKYDRFISEAKDGILWRDGRVTVNGETVMENVWTLGRTTMGRPASVRQPIQIGGKTYYHSIPDVSFAASRQSLPVMVMFDAQGTAEVVIMNACGNVVGGGKKITSSVTCNTLNKVQKDKENKPNEWTFTTNAAFTGNAKLSKVVYSFSDGTPDVVTHSLTEEVTHDFKKSGDVTVTVYASVPGGHEIRSVAVANCKFHVEHKSPKAVCTALVPGALDSQNQKFRFTVKVSVDKNVTVKNADFTVDGKNTTTVTVKDSDGNIYKEYTFTDDQKHTVSAFVRFTTVEGEKTDKCNAEVTSKKTPVCTVPGHENEAPNSPNCGYCLPGVPIGSPQCTPPTELVHTGPGNIIGLFAGTSALGAVGHHLYARRRASRIE